VRVTAVILAAGRGTRMGEEESKAFLPLAGRPLGSYAVHAFLRSGRIDQMVVVLSPADLQRARELAVEETDGIAFVAGGKTRMESSLAGIEQAEGDLVLIHDGARPFPSAALIGHVIEATSRFGACVPVLPATDTLRILRDDGFLDPAHLDRERIVRMQTPQGFRTSLIRRALPECPPNATDDAAAVLALGEPVATVPGDVANLKVTTPEDLEAAESLARRLGLADWG
jgi:2-C-methyl-D-erythritol 4-phosphate cytidylyltransferase